MNLIRRHMLHQLRSRHNPIGNVARFTTLLATVSAVIIALSEAALIREIATADKAMIAELVLVIEGHAKMVETTGKYTVEYEMKRTTYEVK